MSDSEDDDVSADIAAADEAGSAEEIPKCPRCECTHAPEISQPKTIRIAKFLVERSKRQCRHCGKRFFATKHTPIEEDEDE